MVLSMDSDAEDNSDFDKDHQNTLIDQDNPQFNCIRCNKPNLAAVPAHLVIAICLAGKAKDDFACPVCGSTGLIMRENCRYSMVDFALIKGRNQPGTGKGGVRYEHFRGSDLGV
jgi:hypothetical protein